MQKIYLDNLKQMKLSNTKPRRLVFEALMDNGHHPLTMKELLKICSFVDRASVYRAVDSLEKAQIINRIHTGWKYKLELSEAFHGHHHHLVCTMCHEVTIAHENPRIEQEILSLGNESGFNIKEHSLEIYGKCSECS